MTIRCFVQVEPRWQIHAQYALGVLLEGAGLPVEFTTDASSADLAYAPERIRALPAGAMWIRAEHWPDWDDPQGEIRWLGSIPYLRRASPTGANEVSPPVVPFDVVFSTYAVASGGLERAVPADVAGLAVSRRTGENPASILELPVVSLYANLLLEAMRKTLGPALRPVGRWPDGKLYAVVLSHDVDVPFFYRSSRYYRHALKVNGRARAWAATIRSLGALAGVGLMVRVGLLSRGGADPNFRFDEWLLVEATLPGKSCFYVAVTSFQDPAASPYDVPYSIRDARLRSAICEAAQAGWEVGLHASINSREAPARILEEKVVLEDALGGRPVRGVRHHYLALEPRVPERTLWAHAAAGLVYDSSIGFNDIAGYRRGLAWPFEPFDYERETCVPVLEVPLTIMDSAVIDRDTTTEEVGRRLRAHVESARSCGGAAVINWHLESLSNRCRSGRGRAILDVLGELVQDTRAFWATPGELADWWRVRQGRIAAARSGR